MELSLITFVKCLLYTKGDTEKSIYVYESLEPTKIFHYQRKRVTELE